jgi:hypothetical protein
MAMVCGLLFSSMRGVLRNLPDQIAQTHPFEGDCSRQGKGKEEKNGE